jgi:hypothetical protein
MAWLAGTMLAYAIVNFFAAVGFPPHSVGEQDPMFDRVGSGHAMAFYSAGLVIMYAAQRRGQLDIGASSGA